MNLTFSNIVWEFYVFAFGSLHVPCCDSGLLASVKVTFVHVSNMGPTGFAPNA